MVLRKSFYIRWSAGRSPRVHEVNPDRDPSRLPDCRIIISNNRPLKVFHSSLSLRSVSYHN